MEREVSYGRNRSKTYSFLDLLTVFGWAGRCAGGLNGVKRASRTFNIFSYLHLPSQPLEPPRGRTTGGGKRTNKDTTRLLTPRGRRIIISTFMLYDAPSSNRALYNLEVGLIPPPLQVAHHGFLDIQLFLHNGATQKGNGSETEANYNY